MEHLVIDGYNVIGAWPELQRIKTHSLADARSRLVEILKEYQAFTGQHIILVFDAYRTKGAKKTEQYPGLEIRYTDYGQTADSLIESLVSKLAADNQNIGVVTSDWAQQQIVLGKGARRWSSREFHSEVEKVSKQISAAADNTLARKPRTELQSRLNPNAWETIKRMGTKGKQP